MPTNVVMPQMGESIVEGAITKWLKKPGDSVKQDEPLFEISTDKVDAEIPSPVSGVLAEIKAQEGSTVQVNAVVAVIDEAGGKSKPGAKTAPEKQAARDQETPVAKDASAAAASKPPQPGNGAGGKTVNVVMPQMGESIVEGAITKWLKKPGDTVQRDEPLFEISTDKVDAEIPSPESGVLAEVKAQEGSTVQVNSVVAVIRTPGAAAAGETAQAEPAKQPAEATAAAAIPKQGEQVGERESQEAAEGEGGERIRSSPLVRRMAKENNVDLALVPATGLGGRVTKEDIQGYLAKGTAETQPAPAASASFPAAAMKPPSPSPPAPARPGPSGDAPAGQLTPMSKMRAIIAHRMVESKRTSAHVHTVFKIDMSRIVRIREKEKAKYEQRNGVKLTYMPFISRAAIATLRKMPIVNASLEGDSIRYHKSVNLGIAVALDWGLIVPVIRQAEERNFLGIARAIADLAERARAKKLKPDEAGSGTFTITNPGIFGEQFGTPVINQPESAILGVGGLFKEPTVMTDENGSDSIAIRSVIRLTLGFDHRIIDGADAGRFMAEMKKYLENWSEEIG